ncbi:MAG: hypothetical protein MUE53_04690 [Chitinophagales bacterium]|jgi:hypothetical protein|nr:hypothetical protein [Chitinophagales bacterium]
MSQSLKTIPLIAQRLSEIAQDDDILLQNFYHNNWFTIEFTKIALQNILDNFLDLEKVQAYIQSYSISNYTPKSIAIICAGNIPMVFFHDFLCAYLLETPIIQLKLSKKDALLPKILLEYIQEIQDFSKIQIIDRVGEVDKIIATGTNSTYDYFQKYFPPKKSLLRNNRTSIAIIENKDLNEEKINLLLDDVHLFFGLGCRSVSKVFIPEGFDITRILSLAESKYAALFQHQSYMNNYDYQRTLLILNNTPHLSNDFMILQENENLFSPISVLYYQVYQNIDEVNEFIKNHSRDIQLVLKELDFGSSQKPNLDFCADNLDTINFLTQQ